MEAEKEGGASAAIAMVVSLVGARSGSKSDRDESLWRVVLTK